MSPATKAHALVRQWGPSRAVHMAEAQAAIDPAYADVARLIERGVCAAKAAA